MGEFRVLRVYGHYYKLFKGEGGIPREVTVIAIDGDMVIKLDIADGVTPQEIKDMLLYTDY